MRSETVLLGEVCNVVMGQSPPGTSYNTSGDGLPFFQGKTDFGEIYPKVRVFCNQPSRIAEEGDILMSVRAPVGPTNLAKEKCCIGRGLAALRTGARLDTSFLLYFLRHHEPRLASQGQGSTFDAINRDDLEEIAIPLPGLPEQRRIAERLKQADRLGRTRRYALDLAAAFLPAAFRELFGSPSECAKRFPCSQLGEVSDFIDYRGIAPNKSPSGVRLITARNVKRGYFEIDPQEFIPTEEYDSWMTRGFPRPGDVLFTTEGHTLGSAAILPPFEKAALAQRLIVLQPAKQITSGYLLHLIVTPSFQHAVVKRSTGSAARGISSKNLAEIPIPVPPLSLQQSFAVLVERVERLRAVQWEGLRQAEHLFASLLHRAFIG
jgi:type I restriction enzyme, S subunit